MSENTPVLIVGGGPVGLATAIVLGRHGVNSIVCEKHSGVNPHPRAHVVNTRSMELFRSWGIAEAVKGEAIDPMAMLNFVWKSSLAGEELGRVSMLDLPEADILRRMFASPEGAQSCAQDRVERFLIDAVLAQGMCDLRMNTEVVGVEPRPDGVSVSLESEGATAVVEADYVVAADGALSSVRSQLGIKMMGMPPIGEQINVYFHADLSPFEGDSSALLYWVVNSETRGVFIAMDGKERWTFNIEYNPAVESIEDYTPERCLDVLRSAIGAEVDPRIISVGSWTMTSELARSYSAGRVFLAGDAAHRFPPTGGLGMNTGLADADNLAWKLAAVIKEWAPAGLLDSYQAERKPVAQTNAQHSVTNAITMAGTGIGPTGAEIAGRLESDDEATARAERERLTTEIAKQLPHFDALNLELGYRYERSPIITSDGTPTYLPADSARDFDPDAQPGARLPHVELDNEGSVVSSLDLVGPYFLVLAGPQGQAWAEAAAAIEDVPMRSVLIGETVTDPNGVFAAGMGIEASGCLLVRPDGHVAFRSARTSGAETAEIARAVARSIGN